MDEITVTGMNYGNAQTKKEINAGFRPELKTNKL
jgi:hypothetical protein